MPAMENLAFVCLRREEAERMSVRLLVGVTNSADGLTDL